MGVRAVLEDVAALFPRAAHAKARRLRVSEIDEVLLASLSVDEWRSVSDLLRLPKRRSEVMSVLLVYGDAFISYRLSRWERHEVLARTMRKAQPGAVPELLFRLSVKGRTLLDDGLERISRAPRFPVGGWQCYGRTPTWAAVGAHGHRRLVKVTEHG